MMLTGTGYDPKLLEKWKSEACQGELITELLREYMSPYTEIIHNRAQQEHMLTYVKGLMSDLDRKSVEPIALRFLGEDGVRSLQQYLTRSTMDDETIMNTYQHQLSQRINSRNGMLSVDESDFVKKGKDSAGVQRQYCGRLGKTENCQAGVFLAYAGDDGYGLVDRELYIPEGWYAPENAKRRERCRIAQDKGFETKNSIALRMIRKTVESGMFQVKWIGCDSSFGCDHDFLDALPDTVLYFASTKASEKIYSERQDMIMPEKSARKDKSFTHALPSVPPVTVKAVAEDPTIPWRQVVLAEGSKGSILADVKVIRCVFCRRITKSHDRPLHPASDGWLYIRRYGNGDTKYFISNASETVDIRELHEAATLRWPIEQCFEECKGFLGMGHYECRTVGGWRRHMLMVMLAHGFVTGVRLALKKTAFPSPAQWQNA